MVKDGLVAMRYFSLFLLLIICFAVSSQEEVDLTPPEFGDFDPATIEDVNLDDYPVLPTMTDHARLIFERGQEAGRNPAMFSKVGDSMTYSNSFLMPFAADEYELGDFENLQPLIDFIVAESWIEEEEATAFDRANYATQLGFSTSSALDPTWAVAEACEANESPLVCEYRVSNSAFAIIMFGTNDVMFFDEATFDFFLRQVILETINHDVVPIMSTFPIRPEKPDEAVQLNKVIVRIAEDYDLPLINLVKALEDLPNGGVDLSDTLHLTIPVGSTVATFTDEGLSGGYTVRNLVTLLSLDTLMRSLEILPEE
jgi:hypothetical protein